MTLVAALPSPSAAAESLPIGHDAALVPFVGETPAEFEARSHGQLPDAPRERTVSIARDASGHFYTDATVEGIKIRFMVDTGASVVTLTAEDAEHLGLRPTPPEYTRRVATANGIAMAAPVKLSEIVVGEVSLTGVQAIVCPPGKLAISLLGMSFLNRLPGLEMQAGHLILKQ